MPAISDDTAALVAAQLTQACMAVYAQKQGVSGLTPQQIEQRTLETYLTFRRAVGEVDISHARSPES